MSSTNFNYLLKYIIIGDSGKYNPLIFYLSCGEIEHVASIRPTEIQARTSNYYWSRIRSEKHNNKRKDLQNTNLGHSKYKFISKNKIKLINFLIEYLLI